ncbi:MAG TPA: GNAT family N-acetyltransferase [Actinomycetes bacterium]|nr:GNAT family N-acetyltransferase [Actinomycetes bacterium]
MTINTENLRIEQVAFDSATAKELIEELQEEYVARYGGRDETPVDPKQFAPPSGGFLMVFVGREPVGCAGLRKHNQQSVEVKRMFIRRPFRGRGLSRWLLARVEEHGRLLGYDRILMETGVQQPEAMRLYETSGYEPIPGFGYYAQAAQNRCYAKELTGG